MTKAQAAALLLIGSGVGAGGRGVVDAVLGHADAATGTPFVHAVDLRRDYSADAGSSVRFQVWATQQLIDGGTRDVGQAQVCKPGKTSTENARALMNVLSSECSW